MKLSRIVFITSIVLLSGCKHNQTIGKIDGEIKGLENDTIYLYGNDEFAHFLEPIVVKDDKFSLEIPMDTTLIQAMLFIDEDEQYPIYLERGKTIHIKGDVDSPGRYEVKGNSTNEELAEFIQTLPESASPSDTLTLRLVEEYIRTNQKSLSCIYLLTKYFVEVDRPDFAKIKELAGLMHGTLQDKPYIVELTNIIGQAENVEPDKIAPSFTLTNTEGKKISRIDFREKYLLINFWASWCDTCQSSNKDLKALYKAFPPKKENKNKVNKPVTTPKEPELAILSISLDMDKTAWNDAIRRDTLKWEQVSDLTGWNSPVVKQYAVYELPYNILIDSRGKIIARGIGGKDLRQKLDSIFKH